MKCFRCNFVPFFLQTSLKVGNSTGSSLSHFALQNVPHILYWRQVGTAGRPVKYPYPLPPQPGLCNVCRMWFCIVLLKYAWTSLEKMSSWRQHIVLQNLYVLFSINGAVLGLYLDGLNAEHKLRVWVTILGHTSLHFTFTKFVYAWLRKSFYSRLFSEWGTIQGRFC